jgi:TetR/AcrR family transcriptional repressor of nem operon
MRYDTEHKQKTRARVLEEAAKAIRAEGPLKVGVAEVMAKAGLTHGGFYAHFDSKDELVTEAIGQMFREARGRLEPVEDQDRPATDRLLAYVNYYLSRTHRDLRTAGCPLPFLAADAPRLPEASRALYGAGAARLSGIIAGLLAEMGRPEPEALASSVLAEMVGALGLSRADPDPERADLILKRSRAAVKQRLGLEDPS